MKILIAEDDPVSRLMLTKMLQNWGHEVSACTNGIEAWAKFVAGQYSLVLSDWMMPELDGLALCQRIRELRRADYCYFILETAKSRSENLLSAIDAGVDDYLMKPIDMVELHVRLIVAERMLALKSDVRSLQSLLPMCAWCKSVRNDENLWQSVENYLSTHASVDFTHAICPKCLDKQMREAERLASGR
ncbi:MAG TPA: response regulator transcription factor [Blastocatellia bacterium]